MWTSSTRSHVSSTSALTPCRHGFTARPPQLAEPAQPLGIGHGGVGRRRRRAARTATCRRADAPARRAPAVRRRCRGTPPCRRSRSTRDGGRARAARAVRQSPEVGAAEIARSLRRPRSRVRQADAVVEDLELLLRAQQPRSEACRVQEAPEVVSRIGEVRGSRRRDPAGVDAAEDDPEAGREHVGDGRDDRLSVCGARRRETHLHATRGANAAVPDQHGAALPPSADACGGHLRRFGLERVQGLACV